MSLLERLCKEMEQNPELGRKFLEKLMEVEPRLSLAFQIERLISEIRQLAEGLFKLREDFNREITSLREEQGKVWDEIAKLREDFNRMLKVIEGLQRDYRAIERRLEESFLSLNEAMIRGFWGTE